MDGAETVMYVLRKLISKMHIIKLVPLKAGPGCRSDDKSVSSILIIATDLVFG